MAAIARLHAGATPEQAAVRIETLFRRLAADRPKTSTGFGVHVSGLQDDLTASQRPALLLLLGAVALVLLIACANVANLLLARASGRSKEIAVRIALGASVGRLMRQLLTESLLLGALGGVAGIALAKVILGATAKVDAPLDITVALFAGAIALASGLLFGVAPALQLVRSDPHGTIKSASLAAGGSSALRGALVVVEFAMALILTAGAGILVKSFLRLMNVDPGFDPKGVLSLRVALDPAQQPEPVFHRLNDRLRELPGVESVAVTNGLPLTPGMAFTKRFNVVGSPLINPDALPGSQTRFVSPDYFRTLRIPLRSGRLFTERDLNQPVVVINESMARRYWPGEDPVGRKYMTDPFGPNPGFSTIIGVVGDVKQTGLDAGATMDEYFLDLTPRYVLMRTRGDPAALSSAARAAIREADAGLPVSDVRPLSKFLTQSAADRRWTVALLGAFAGVALLLALVGIYGVISWSVAQRAREIGIRMALGARPAQVLASVVARAMRLTALGLATGLAGALALRQALAALVFEVSTADPWIYGAGVALMIAAALAASWIPARRAAKMDPLVALRQD
jgi:predicted permease